MEEQKQSVLIIGSGLGGLMCGALLGMEGYQVTIVDMNKQTGGNLQSFTRDKKIFDSGVHYVGGLEKGQNLYQIFKYLGIMDKFHLEKLEEDAFDKIVFLGDKKEYAYAQGYERFIESLVADFPDEREAIVSYCDKIREICASFPLYNIRHGSGLEKSPHLGIDAKAYIESLTKNVRLRNVLAGNNLLYAGVSNETPFYVHALVLNSYIESSWKFLHGGSQIAKQLVKIIHRYGGVVKTRVEVTKIVVDDESRKVTHVECRDGSTYTADHVISSMHPSRTLAITDTSVLRPAYRNRINSLTNSSSAFVIYATLKPGKIPYEKTNYYCYKEEDVWESMHHKEENWPLSYAVFHTASDKAGEYTEAMTLMCYMHYDEVKKWENTFNTVGRPSHRGDDYEAFTKAKTERFLDLVEEQIPGLKEAIHTSYTATPLTFKDYMGTDDGSVYGIIKDFKDPLKTFISPRIKVQNLFLTGQNINLHGILGVAMSAIVTSMTIIGNTDLVDKIRDAQVEEMV